MKPMVHKHRKTNSKTVSKKLLFIVLVLASIIGCTSSKNTVASNAASDTLRIANDQLEYEVIIIEPGFNSWLASSGRPRGYYSESYLEARNQMWVQEWNSRVMQPDRFNSRLYEMRINYDSNIHYGYEVNYLIYNYLVYFQLHYNQQLGGFAPRI